MARRISRQELKRDEIVDAAVDAGHWLEDHWRTAAGVAGAVALVVLAVVGWSVWSRQQQQARELRLADAIVEFERVEGAGFVDRDALDRVLATFGEIAAGSAPLSHVAGLYRGSCLLHGGRAGEAIPVLEEAARAAEGTLTGPANSLLAQAYQQEGRTEEAIEVLKRLLEHPDPTVPKDQTLLQLGTLYESAGRTEEARQQFQRILDEHPSSIAAQAARQELAS
jgi:tetratricopeptide (TPR) repeat protein